MWYNHNLKAHYTKDYLGQKRLGGLFPPYHKKVDCDFAKAQMKVGLLEKEEKRTIVQDSWHDYRTD